MINIWDKTFPFVYYQDKYFYYFRKPADLSSTRWKSVSFLDLMIDDNSNIEIRNIVESQIAFFWKEKELWLLNRLDSSTSWLLYFAKNPKVYNNFRNLQANNQVDKFYIAEVYWDIQKWIDGNWAEIKYPIMHHKFADDRMIVVCKAGDEKKWKWKLHEVKTEITEVQYLSSVNRSIVLIKIHKWIRHQIRMHLSSIWFPICGDTLYCKSKANQDFDKLQLFSVWFWIEDGLI